MRQLALDFPALERDPLVTHVETSCQRAAVTALAGSRDWPGGMLAVVGPEGAGKSHLAALWSAQTGARRLTTDGVLDGVTGPLVVEDPDREPIGDRRLLALIDAARSGEIGPVLFTARTPPALWPAGLPDLASRLALVPVATIGDPTDADLGAVLAKRLADHGAEAPDNLIEFVVRRIERSLAAAGAAAAALDRAALERKQRVTRSLAREVLAADDVSADDPAEGRLA